MAMPDKLDDETRKNAAKYEFQQNLNETYFPKRHLRAVKDVINQEIKVEVSSLKTIGFSIIGSLIAIITVLVAMLIKRGS